jgi:hypothetical protein
MRHVETDGPTPEGAREKYSQRRRPGNQEQQRRDQFPRANELNLAGQSVFRQALGGLGRE